MAKTILRDYQLEAVQEICEGFQHKNKQLCVLPTGSGKTVVFSNVVGNLRKKTLIVAHTSELINQIKSSISREVVDMSCDIYHYSYHLNSDVVICSFHSAIMGKTLEKLKNQNFELLIIDECHRAACKGYKKIISKLGFENKNLLGVTATPFRTDKKSVYEIFGLPTFEIDILEMIGKNFLCDFKGYRIKTDTSLKGLRTQHGDFQASKLEPVINTANRNSLIVESYMKVSPNEKALCFCSGVQHAKDLRDEFRRRGISCESMSGRMGKQSRKDVIRNFKEGKIQVLTNCNILTEGFDEPSITSLIMARPTMSKTLYMQMIGRGSRTFPGKKFCKVIEFTDNHFDVCSIEDIVSGAKGKVTIEEGESLTDFKDRATKELELIGTSTVVEDMPIIVKPDLHDGLIINGFEIVGSIDNPKNTPDKPAIVKKYYIMKHTCGSTFTISDHRVLAKKDCVLCSRLNEKNGRITYERIETRLNGSTLYASCDCGNPVQYNTKERLNIASLLKESKSCGCLRKDINHSKTDKYVGTTIENAYISEKLNNDSFRCRCLKCSYEYEKTTKQLLNSVVACPKCGPSRSTKMPLSEKQVFNILYLNKKEYRNIEISSILGIGEDSVSEIIRGKTYKAYRTAFESLEEKDYPKDFLEPEKKDKEKYRKMRKV